jgi:hypothetical protein
VACPAAASCALEGEAACRRGADGSSAAFDSGAAPWDQPPAAYVYPLELRGRMRSMVGGLVCDVDPVGRAVACVCPLPPALLPAGQCSPRR